MKHISRFAKHEYRWFALIVIALGLAIVIIDNTVLNVSIPYILRDLEISFSSLQWAISGYALTIAAVLITVGRLGDMFGYKKLFLIGILIFVIGSFTASESRGAATLIIGRAVIQAVGAAITLTSALSLLASTFKGKERAIAFGIWGSVAGASAAIGPLLGGYLTTYFTWRWSLRINIVVGLIALIGSVFISESRKSEDRCFDWIGMLFSALSLFLLVFAFIQGGNLGWWNTNGSYWPFSISVIPFIFLSSIMLLYVFIRYEMWFGKKSCPLLRISMFRNAGFSMGLGILGLLALGQFGTFLVLPIYLENVLGLNALQVGLTLLSISISLFIFGTLSGFLASRFNIKWIVFSGIVFLFLGSGGLILSIGTKATIISLSPALIIFGIGFGLAMSQLNNVIISSAPNEVVGEASATSITIRQVGFALGIALIGAILGGSLALSVEQNINSDNQIPDSMKAKIISELKNANIEGGKILSNLDLNKGIEANVKQDVDLAISTASRYSVSANLVLTILAGILAFFMPRFKDS